MSNDPAEKNAKIPGYLMAILVAAAISALGAAGGAFVGEKQLEVRVEQLETSKRELTNVPSQLALALDHIETLTRKVDQLNDKLDRADRKSDDTTRSTHR